MLRIKKGFRIRMRKLRFENDSRTYNKQIKKILPFLIEVLI